MHLGHRAEVQLGLMLECCCSSVVTLPHAPYNLAVVTIHGWCGIQHMLQCSQAQEEAQGIIEQMTL